MPDHCTYKPYNATVRAHHLLDKYSDKPFVLAKTLAAKRFARCDACEDWDFLVVHHWTQKDNSEKTYTRELCNRCNAALASFPGKEDHVLPPWCEQLAWLWRRGGPLDQGVREQRRQQAKEMIGYNRAALTGMTKLEDRDKEEIKREVDYWRWELIKAEKADLDDWIASLTDERMDFIEWVISTVNTIADIRSTRRKKELQEIFEETIEVMSPTMMHAVDEVRDLTKRVEKEEQ